MGESVKKKNSGTGQVSRRNFIATAVAGAGAAATVLSTAQVAKAEAATNIPIKRPEAFNKTTSGVKKEFPMTGAEVFARACKEEGLAALFCCPGNYGVVNAIASEGIPVYSGRGEGPLCHAADGFCRVTGEIAATSGTEGPGFTNMINAIATANAARSPILVLASNMSMRAEDTEGGIQLMYQQPLTEGIKKYGKRMINPSRIHEYAGYAFRKLRSGIPKPVHLDFPSEVGGHRFESAKDLDFFYDKSKYRTDAKPYPDPKQIKAAVELIKKAERPLIVSSNGVFHAKAWNELKAFSEKAQIPVAESGAMKGQISHDSPLCANGAYRALSGADLVILVGQYCMFPPGRGNSVFGPETKYIRLDPDWEDIGRNLPIEVGIVSCEKAGLAALTEACPPLKHDSWLADLKAGQKELEKENDEYYKYGLGISDALHPAVMAKELADFVWTGNLPKEQTTFNSGGFGTSRYMRRYWKGYRPGQLLNGAYQFGAIGPDVAFALGTCAAVRQGIGPQAPYKGAPVVCVTSDAGVGYTIMEMETAAKYKMPIIVVVYNNNAWGTFTQARNSELHLSIHLFQENVRYDKVAEGLGAHGEYVTTPGDFKPALARAYELASKQGVPSLINCQGRKEFWGRENGAPGFLQNLEPAGYLAYHH